MKDLILEYQNKWAIGIVEIGKTKNNFEESSSVTTKFIHEVEQDGLSPAMAPGTVWG